MSDLSHQLSVNLGDAVDGPRSLHAQVRRGVTGRRGAEGADCAGYEKTQAVLRSDVQDVVKP